MLACPSPFQEIQSSCSNGTTSAARPMGGTRILELPNYRLCWKEKLSQFLLEFKENQQVDYERARRLIIEKMAPAGFLP